MPFSTLRSPMASGIRGLQTQVGAGRPGSLDNRTTRHRRDAFDPVSWRIMHRTQIEGSSAPGELRSSRMDLGECPLRGRMRSLVNVSFRL